MLSPIDAELFDIAVKIMFFEDECDLFVMEVHVNAFHFVAWLVSE